MRSSVLPFCSGSIGELMNPDQQQTKAEEDLYAAYESVLFMKSIGIPHNRAIHESAQDFGIEPLILAKEYRRRQDQKIK